MLRISDISLADVGDVYCELSSGVDTVTSRLATLSIKKVFNKSKYIIQKKIFISKTVFYLTGLNGQHALSHVEVVRGLGINLLYKKQNGEVMNV